MTSFFIVSAAMVAAALLWLILPLLRAKPASDPSSSTTERRVSAVAIVLAFPLLAAAMYAGLSNWDWKGVAEDEARIAEATDTLKKLEARVRANPDDAEAWLELGRLNVGMQRFPRGVQAYERAYELTRGEDVNAILGLGEALAMSDESALGGRAGQLFEQALARAPNHPKALWYGAVAALQTGDLPKARDRLQIMLAQNPPAELRSMLQRQVEDLNQQIAEAAEGSRPAEGGAQAAARTIRVAVSLAPQLKEKLQEPRTLFVLARDPAGGPPLAVHRLSSTQVPLTVELTERDAMMPTRTIASVPRVQVVARVSASGNPQAQSGDYFGQADYEFGKDTGTLNILIDQVVP
jgi:cytochrome c-type biogenesis protein CcmH